ncbi:unnamed protein product, partial [Staurois parvus]
RVPEADWCLAGGRGRLWRTIGAKTPDCGERRGRSMSAGHGEGGSPPSGVAEKSSRHPADRCGGAEGPGDPDTRCRPEGGPDDEESEQHHPEHDGAQRWLHPDVPRLSGQPGESVDMSIKGMYTLMARCEELDRSMQPIHTLAKQIREIKRTLEMFETLCK